MEGTMTPRESALHATECRYDYVDAVYAAHESMWRERREERVARRQVDANEPTMVPFLAGKTWPARKRGAA